LEEDGGRVQRAEDDLAKPQSRGSMETLWETSFSYLEKGRNVGWLKHVEAKGGYI